MQKYEYQVIEFYWFSAKENGRYKDILSAQAQEGWEFVSLNSAPGNGNYILTMGRKIRRSVIAKIKKVSSRTKAPKKAAKAVTDS